MQRRNGGNEAACRLNGIRENQGKGAQSGAQNPSRKTECGGLSQELDEDLELPGAEGLADAYFPDPLRYAA